MKLKYLVWTIIILIVQNSYAQDSQVKNARTIEDILAQDSLKLAKHELDIALAYYKKIGAYNRLVPFVRLIGNAKLYENNKAKAVEEADDLVAFIKTSKNKVIYKNSLLIFSNVYLEFKDFQKAYAIIKEANGFELVQNRKNDSLVNALELNRAKSLAGLGNSKDAARIINALKQKANTERIAPDLATKVYEFLADQQNRLQQLDSGNYYNEKALTKLDLSKERPLLKHIKKGNLKNEIALNLFNSGKTEASILKMKEAIAAFQDAIPLARGRTEEVRIKSRKFASVDNLGGFYRGLENTERLIQIVTYSFEEKKKFLPENDQGLIISKLILAHSHLVARNLDLADAYVDDALDEIENAAFLKDYALVVRASIYENAQEMEKAEATYKLTEEAYREKENPYNLGFLDALVEMSRFYVKIDKSDKAIALAEEGYNYTHRKEFGNALIEYYQTTNLARIHYESGNYREALKYINEGLTYFSENKFQGNSLLDSIQNIRFKPSAISVKLQSEYFLENNRNATFLKRQLQESSEAMRTIATVKRILTSSSDVETLFVNSQEIIAFRKKILRELYNLNDDKEFLEQLLSLHESSVYTRIRSRLNLKNVQFLDVPAPLLSRERKLKENIGEALEGNSDLQTYFNAETKWNSFLDSLRLVHPKYYKMRYGTVEEPLDELQQSIPENTTLVRYFFIGEELQVYVATKHTETLIPLTFQKGNKQIEMLSDYRNDLETISNASHFLYQQLWAPIAAKVQTEKVIIFPDGELFNLSFDLLTSDKINSYKEYSSKSLLAKHDISYNYSLLLLNENKKPFAFEKDFVAFAPEFSDRMKKDYEIAIKDAIDLDQKYLTLLPQPSSAALAKEYTNRFNGSSFLNKKASKQIFASRAKEHRIIHIGTHAESNNVSPELSRLIFAKNVDDPDALDDNSVYTYEIYNYNLASNLAILTACETGKPTYQAGEGMISLAHAFNYAGSESVLTSLWMIDEQSSAKILDHFYGYLEEGFDKDAALRKAKLDYLANANDDTLSPQYWSGMVLMGDIQPIGISSSMPILFWIGIIGGMLLVAGLVYRFKSRA